MPPTVDDAIPGSDLVRAGLDDLATGHLTVEALLLVQAPRAWVRRALRADRSPRGTDVPPIEREVGPRRAHARYNALRRRLLSFIRAAPLVSR